MPNQTGTTQVALTKCMIQLTELTNDLILKLCTNNLKPFAQINIKK